MAMVAHAEGECHRYRDTGKLLEYDYRDWLKRSFPDDFLNGI